MNWPLWFVQLSGWPVFLATVGIVFVLMIGLSVVLTWLGRRSALHSMALTVLALTIATLGLLAILAMWTR